MNTKNQGNWNPSQYEKFKNERTRPFLDLMSLVEPIDKAVTVDLGCGTGELTKLMHDHLKASSTLGLDSSLEMLQKSKSFEEASLTFKQANIEEWTSETKYDLIFSNSALQWCENHERLFANIFHATKVGGQIAIQMPMNHDYPTHILAQEMSHEPHWNKLLNGNAYDKYSSLLSMDEYARLLFKLGFREQKIEMKVYGHILTDRSGVVEWVKGSMLSYFRSHMSEKDYADFLIEFENRLFAILPDERPFFYPFKRLFIWGRK